MQRSNARRRRRKAAERKTHKLLAVLGRLEKLLAALGLGFRLQPGLDGLVLLVKVGHVLRQTERRAEVRQMEGRGRKASVRPLRLRVAVGPACGRTGTRSLTTYMWGSG